MLRSVYCIGEEIDTDTQDGLSHLQLNVFDRRDGKAVADGVAWFYSAKDTSRALLYNGQLTKSVRPGEHVIGISILGNEFLGFSTRKKITL